MNAQEFNLEQDKLLALAREIAYKKRPAYTQGNADVLTNFKNAAKRENTTPRKILRTLVNKHWDAFLAWCEGDHIPQAEPIEQRFADIINYLLLANGLRVEALKEPDKPVDIYNLPDTGLHFRNTELGREFCALYYGEELIADRIGAPWAREVYEAFKKFDFDKVPKHGSVYKGKAHEPTHRDCCGVPPLEKSNT